MATDLRCPACSRPLPRDPAELAALQACPACRKPLHVAVLPGYGRGPVTGRPAETITGEGEAACFFHATRKAVVPCDECGRFLCALCDIPIDHRHLCPTCLQAAPNREHLPELERNRARPDMLGWYLNLALFTCVGAPIALVGNLLLLFLRWNKASSRVANTRASMVAATLVAALGTAAFAFALIGIG